MTSLETTTPPKKQKKSFGMRSILTVVGLSLFFIVAISGVLIAQRQSQVKEAVAPTAPVSRPSAVEPVTTNVCRVAFSVAFNPGPNTPATYACDAPCTDDYQCKDVARGGNVNYTCYQPTAGTAENWTTWLNVTEAVPDNTSSGYITSFSSHTRPDNSIKQYVVRDGKLYVRTSDTNLGNWTGLIGPNTAVDGVGSGTLTSFSAFITPGTNLIQQHATKGGKIWSRTSPDDSNWSAWEDHTANVAGVGTGAVRSFTAFIMPDGSIKQFLIVGNELYVRTSNATRTSWGNFEGPNSALAGVGGGDITSLAAYTKPDKSIKQFAVVGGALFARDNAGGKCRLSTLPTANDCQAVVVPGTATCTSKKAFTDFSTITTSTELTSATPLKKGQEFVYRITAKGGTTPAANVTITDQLPAELTYVGPVGDSVITHSNGLVTVTYPTVGETPKVAEFKVKVAATAVAGANVINKATIKTEGANPSECSVTLKVEAAAADYSCNEPCTTTSQCQDTTKGGNALYSCDTTSQTCRLTTNPTSTTCEAATVYACNTTCTSDSQCKTVNNDWVCAADQGNRCRLDTNRGSVSCEAPPKTYTCNATCDDTAQCQTYNSSYVCYNAGGTTGKVCRLSGTETSTSCQTASAPPPTPTIGCNQTCATNADCSNTDHICYDTALVGQTAGKVCRLANYVNSSTCTTPSSTVAYTPPTTTKGGQPALPAELPQTGPEDWLNWLKAGLITLGVGAALLLLL